jgi:putative SOS response-associated peptidase YedK
MAGLWERWRDPATDETLESCCLVTTSPSAAVAHVHDRMPAIVPPARYAEWLDPGNTATARLADLLVPCELPALAARPVSRRVNDARNQGAALVEPVGTSDDPA